MPNIYVVFDADKKFNNVIICEEDWVLPEGFSKQLIDDQHYWNWEKQEILINKNAPIKIESI
jgi:hypothetical protein